MRLFTAIDLPSAIRNNLHRMGSQVNGARAVPSEQIHLTLSFIGEVRNEMLQPVTEALAAIESETFTLVLQGVGRFPPRGLPRVIWAGVRPQPQLNRLHALINEALLPFGIIPEERGYTPHITIARINAPAIREVEQFIESQAGPITAEIPITEFLLYSSRLTAQGAVHRVERRYPFAS
jgi:2'-5' RNA ligase